MFKFRDYKKDTISQNIIHIALEISVIVGATYLFASNFEKILLGVEAGLKELTVAFTPLIIGIIIAYILSPFADAVSTKLESHLITDRPRDPCKIEKTRNNMRLAGIIIALIIVFAVVGGLIYGFAVLILDQFVFTDLGTAVRKLSGAYNEYRTVTAEWLGDFAGGILKDDAEALIDRGLNIFMGTGAKTFSGAKAFAGDMLDILIGIFLAFYLMKDKDFFLKLIRKFMHISLPQKLHGEVSETLAEINKVLSSFLRGTLFDVVIIATISAISLAIIGIDYAVFIGVFAGIVNIIPYLGPILGMVPAFVSGFFSGGPVLGVASVIALIIIQQLDTNIIYPKVVGNATGLHPAFVLLAVAVFGYFKGIAGMILAVPLAGIIQVFVIKGAFYLSNKRASSHKRNTTKRRNDS